MDTKRFLRYLAPNLVTFTSLLFGLFSIRATMEGRYVDAAWFVVYSVLTDKLDGFVARLVKGTSEFGVQLDSFADFLNFGVAPATLFYGYLSRAEPTFAEGWGLVALLASCVLWLFAVTFRLARYNIVGDDPRCHRIFFGFPTTLIGGISVAVFLAALKYGADVSGAPGAVYRPSEWRIPGLHIPAGIWRIWPVLVVLGAFAMASTIKVPKLARSRSKALTAFIFGNVSLGYACGVTTYFPEYMGFAASCWVVVSLVYSSGPSMRGLKPPPLFPKQDPAPGKAPVRPEEDVEPEEPGEAPAA